MSFITSLYISINYPETGSHCRKSIILLFFLFGIYSFMFYSSVSVYDCCFVFKEWHIFVLIFQM